MCGSATRDLPELARAVTSEEVIYRGKQVEYIRQRARGFLDLTMRKEAQRVEMWHGTKAFFVEFWIFGTPASALPFCTHPLCQQAAALFVPADTDIAWPMVTRGQTGRTTST